MLAIALDHRYLPLLIRKFYSLLLSKNFEKYFQINKKQSGRPKKICGYFNINRVFYKEMNQYQKLLRAFLIPAFCVLLSAIFVSAAKAAGEVDASFNAAVSGTTNGLVYVVKTQPDGKILIGGIFTDVQGQAANGVGRLNADGSVDTSFNPPVFFNGSSLGARVLALGLQSDGKIIVAGSLYGINGVFAPAVMRLNPNGTIDSSFNLPVPQDSNIYTIEVLPNDKFFIGGEFGRNIAKFNADGTPDNSFSATGIGLIKDIEVQPDGKVVFITGMSGPQNYVRRLNADGSVDSGFSLVTVNQTIEVVKIQADGKLIIGGSFTFVNGFQQGRISRINSDGSLDLNFNLNNFGAGSSSYGINDIIIRPDGKIFIAGDFPSYNAVNIRNLALLSSDGTLDNSFSNNAQAAALIPIFDIELQSDGKILIGGQIYPLVGGANPILRLNAGGTTDSAFDVKVRRLGIVTRILQQPDGKILIAGEFPSVNGVVRQSLARLNADGSLDTSFVPYYNGTFTTSNPTIRSIALQPDGKILIIGTAVNFVRLNPDGSRDTGFTWGGTIGINDIAVLPDGKIITVGGSNSKIIERLNSNGSLDNTFIGVQAPGLVNKVLVQPDGKFLIGGTFSTIASNIRGRIARLNADGTLDNTFNPPGGANDVVYDIDLQTDGKVVLVGQFTALNGNSNMQKVGRLNADGTLDTSFVQTANATILAVKIQPDGKILIGGAMSTVGNQYRIGIARLNANGSFDLSFGGETNTSVWDINLQTDGKILIGGEFTKVNGVSGVRVKRLLNASAPLLTLFDYDGDGRADVSAFRPSTNRWYELLSNATVAEQTFGLAGDVPAPADYDGDGKTDIGIFRPASGDWWFLSSINNTQNFVHWGASGDVPRPGDFDSDGKADFIVFRPSNNTWYRLGTTGAVSIIPFGLAGDKPVRGDFDGDGKVDPAIFRPSTGDWWYQSSIDNAQRATRWGISTDVPAPADFDGDGKTDIAVYRPSNGVWYIINSSNGSFTINAFGIAEDKPVPADYDGDGRADIAVFRPSTGVWYLMRSSAGVTAFQFGVSTDVPTENAFVP